MARKSLDSLRIWTACLFCLMLFEVHGGAQAAADDLGFDLGGDEMLLFEDIPSVFGASKHEQKITEAPSSVSIVTAEEIKAYGYKTMADILKSLRGFYVTSDLNYQFVGVRGFGRPGDYNSRLLVLIDGHSINERIYDGAAIDELFPLDVDLIDRVEVIRGPSSSLYGTGAFFGVVNVITKRGRDLQGGEVAVAGDPFEEDYYVARATYGNKYQNGLEVILSGTMGDYNGLDWHYPEFDDPATNNGVAEDLDWQEHNNLFLRASMSGLTMSLKYVEKEDAYPTAPWDTEFNHSESYSYDEQLSVDLEYEHTFENQLRVKGRVTYDYYDYEQVYAYDWNYPDPPPDIFIGQDLATTKFWGYDIEVGQTLFERHHIIAGASYIDIPQQDQAYLDDKDDSSSILFDSEETSEVWAVFIQDEITLLDNLILTLGVRFDDFSTFGSTTNPRFALIYSPWESSTLKLLYGESFRAPSAYEEYYHDGEVSMKQSEDLTPEEIDTYEVAWEQFFSDKLRGVASLYYYELENIIELVEDPADELLVFQNAGDVEAYGLELELEGKLDNGVKGRISYTYQKTEDQSSGEWLTNAPKHLGKINLIAPLYEDKLTAGLEGQYVSKTKTVQDNETDDYTVLNITLLSQSLFLDDLELSASIYNLFDKGYTNSGGGEHLQDQLEQLGRHYRLKATYAF